MKKYILTNKYLALSTLVLNLILAAATVYMSIIIRDIINYALDLNSQRLLDMVIFATIYCLLLIATEYISLIVVEKFRAKVIRNFRDDVFSGLIKQDVGKFNSVNSADYISMLTNDIQLVDENYLAPFVFAIANAAKLILAVGLMIYLDPLVTATVIVCIILLIVIPNFFSPGIQKRQTALSQNLSLFTIKIKDVFSGFEIVKSYQMDQHVRDSFNVENQALYKSKLKLGYIFAAMSSVSMLLGILSQFGTLILSAYLIIQGRLSAGALVAIVQTSGQIINPIQGLSSNIPMIKGSKAVINRLMAFANLANNSEGEKVATFTNDLSLKNVSYTYPDQEVAAIEQLNFDFKKNQKYALVGKSGCGKTTLVKALIGHLHGYQGQVLYDEDELLELTSESFGKISTIVHQNVYMFDETIEENITLHKTYNEAVVNTAVLDSGVELFLNDDKPLQTPVGENGANLSGGQKQRIAIARALIQNKPLLILDEGTSAVDKQTATDIENKLLSRQNLTLITITHTLDARLLKQYDEIIYMVKGRIVESGSFSELMANQSQFSKYFNA